MIDHTFQFARPPFAPRGDTPILLSVEIKRLIPTVMRLVRLYQVAFPDRQPTIQINSKEDIIKALVDFLSLVDIHHFPLNPLWRQTEEDNYCVSQDGYPIHPWLFEMPVRPVGYVSHDIEPETYGEAVAFITRLGWLGGIEEIALPHKKKLFGNHLTWDWSDLDSLRLTPLIPILEQMNLPAPLDGLPALIKMVQHNTDTFFLDACSLCGSFSAPEFEWTDENFLWLRGDWKKAKPIYQKAEAVNQWADTPERLHLIWTTLRQAHSRLPKR